MRTIVFLLFCVILSILLIPFLLLCYLLRCTKPLMSIGKWTLRIGEKILGVKLEVSGIEKIDKKTPYIFMANHLSFLDGPMLFMLIPQPVRVILKKEVFRIPIIGQAMKQVGFIPVDRKRLKGGKESIDRASRFLKEKGYSFLIFPEGTRSRNGRLQSFKRGGFFLAINSQVPIVPVTIRGSYELMPKGRFFVNRGEIRINFHPPTSVQGFDRQRLPQLIENVRNIIQSGLED